VTGGTVGGSTPNATLTIAGGSAPSGTSALIASAIGVDLNTAGDTPMTLSAFATGKFFVVDYVLATNASTSLTAVVGTVTSGAGGTGQQYWPATLGLSSLVVPRDWMTPLGANTTAGGSDGTMQNTAPIVNVSVPQGAPATADFYVYGRVFS
jgi:hypothetical protein